MTWIILLSVILKFTNFNNFISVKLYSLQKKLNMHKIIIIFNLHSFWNYNNFKKRVL